jgi:hypothetical protein
MVILALDLIMNYDNSKKFYPKKLIAQLQIGFALSIISFLNIKYIYIFIYFNINIINSFF